MAFLLTSNKFNLTNKNRRFSIYLPFWVLWAHLQTFLENRMISRTARLTLASLVSASIALSPLSVLAADPAPAPVPAVAPTPAPAAAPSDKAEAKKAKKQAKQQKKAEKKAKKKSKKKAKATEVAAQ